MFKCKWSNPVCLFLLKCPFHLFALWPDVSHGCGFRSVGQRPRSGQECSGVEICLQSVSACLTVSRSVLPLPFEWPLSRKSGQRSSTQFVGRNTTCTQKVHLPRVKGEVTDELPGLSLRRNDGERAFVRAKGSVAHGNKEIQCSAVRWVRESYQIKTSFLKVRQVHCKEKKSWNLA